MAFINEQTTSMVDFFTKLDTFLAAQGWTTAGTGSFGAGVWHARKTGSGFDIAMAAQWDTASPNRVALYQWRNAAYNGGVSPWQQNEDSGNGAASTSDAVIINSRHVVVSNTPVQYWCFEGGAENYAYVEVQSDATRYRPFGMGQILKLNDFVGGEFVYGHRQDTTNAGNQSFASGGCTYLLDGILSNDPASLPTGAEFHAATMHLQGLDEQGAAERWMVAMGNQPAGQLGNDRQGTPEPRRQILGGYRGGPFLRPYGQFPSTLGRALVPGTPVFVNYYDRTANAIRPLGQMKDVYHINMRDYEPGQEITEVGGDTYVVFPATRKQQDTSVGTGGSGHLGIAYRKVV